MELNKISEGLFELVDSATGTVITRGSWDHCFDCECEMSEFEFKDKIIYSLRYNV